VGQAENRSSILIVDDNEPMRLLLAHIVTQELRAEVTLAGTCEDALRLATRDTYDVILLDLLMPGIGGFEVLRRIREGSVNRSTPVIVVSVRGTSVIVREESVSIDRATTLGANAVVFKPFTNSQLILAVKEQLHAKV
jgi:CheY-like chemotaxis protein